MRGQAALIAMRRRGVAPQWVFIDTGDEPNGPHGDWQFETPYRAHVEVSSRDMLSSLDFRFVVGLSVLIMGEDRRRLDGIAEACAECGAKRIVVAHTVVQVDPHRPGAPRVLSQGLTDTAEAEDAPA